MKLRIVFVSGVLLSLTIGCAGSRRLHHIEALCQDPTWPKIRAAAVQEVSLRERNSAWSHTADYAPEEHTNGVWYVVASGDRLYNLGDNIDILLKDSGEVLSYSIRMPERHPP